MDRMRSIGRKNIKLVQKITLEEIVDVSDEDVEDRVVARLPEKLWDTWEMADQQIRRIIMDVVMNFEKYLQPWEK
jgi:hypothetical protein